MPFVFNSDFKKGGYINNMKKEKYIFRCSECAKTVEYTKGIPAPKCCNKKMVKDPLPFCTSADNPEMARSNDEGDACDDGTKYVD